MVFSSLEFIFLFLTSSVLVYFLVPWKLKNLVLLLFSLFFYGWGEPKYLYLMIITITIDYVFGFLIGITKDKKPSRAKLYLVLAVVINLSLLGFFKYADFFIGAVNSVFSLSIPLLGIPLPIGISFYTFQSLSYVIDVYRNDAPYQKNIFSFGAYVTLFPQLIAGPIVRYKDVDDQLNSRTHSLALFASGIRTFTAGLAKKVLLGNCAASVWEVLRLENTTLAAWLAIIFYTFHIYFDFSGYSDMAVGLGKMLGFTFRENFDYPYISNSITDFWRRWHISLSSWFREYLYIPLGGNRCSKARMFFNLFIVWFCTGFWHGANWNFILWGLYYFIILMIEKTFLMRLLDKLPQFVRMLSSFLLVMIGWVLFAFVDLGEGVDFIARLFGGAAAFTSSATTFELLRHIFFIAIMVIAATPLPRKLFWKYWSSSKIFRYISSVVVPAVLVICVAYLVDSSYNPFIYTRF